MIHNKYRSPLWLFIGVSLFAVATWAFTVPRLTGPVVDSAKLLPPALEQSIGEALKYLKSQGGSQLQVLTVPDLQGEPIESASIAVTDQWKLGSETQDNGVLLLVSLKEKKIRIEVGQGLEGSLPDAHAKRIIDTVMIPLFRTGHPESAILLGVMNIAKRTDPNINLDPYFDGKNMAGYRQVRKQSAASRFFSFVLLFVMIIVFIRNPWLLLLLLASGGRGGGGFGGRGGGGWSGGGGGFSGGGASGGW